MTIYSVDYYYGFPMRWRDFSKTFLKKDIDHMYVKDQWGNFVDFKEEFSGQILDEFSEYVNPEDDESPRLTNNIVVTQYPHDLGNELFPGKDYHVMVGVLVESISVEGSPEFEADDGETNYLHRPLFCYNVMAAPAKIEAAKKKWEQEIKTLNIKFSQIPMLYKSANDCACCS